MNTKTLLLSIMALCSSILVEAQKVETIKLYPKGAPDSNGITEKEYIEGDCIHNISEASMDVYHPAQKSSDACIIICPGGAYICEAYDHEGKQYAQWLSQQGITAIVLKYRLPNMKFKEIPLEDVVAAKHIAIGNAKKWGINPEKIGISGFSAGGHLASTAATHLAGTSDAFQFAILFYPVITMDEELTHPGSRHFLLGDNPSDEDVLRYSNEKRVTPQTPPTLLLLSDDDGLVNPMNSIRFYAALKANNVPAAMYIFPTFGHGWGFRSVFTYHEAWKSLLLQWLKDNKI